MQQYHFILTVDAKTEQEAIAKVFDALPEAFRYRLCNFKRWFAFQRRACPKLQMPKDSLWNNLESK